MLQVARLAPKLLGASAENVRAFVESQLVPGGCAGRDGTPDIYYSVFAVDTLHALQAPPAIFRDLTMSRKGEDLSFRDLTMSRKDLVPLACLARLAAGVPGLLEPDLVNPLGASIRSFRRPDGGFAPDETSAGSTVFASFLGLGALQDLSSPVSAPEALGAYVRSAVLEDGGFSLAPGIAAATTPTTAAAVTVLRQVGLAIPPATAGWLEARAHPQGGFVAGPGVPVPDLLSTAVALHALSTLERPLDRFREACLDFVDTLWSSKGGFYGHWADDHLDCEYTFYGLLALGHLT